MIRQNHSWHILARIFSRFLHWHCSPLFQRKLCWLLLQTTLPKSTCSTALLSCILTGLITWRYNSNFAPFQTKTNNMLSVEKFIFMLFPIAVILVMAYSLHDWQLLALLVLMVIIHKMFLYFLTLFHNGCLLISHNARPSGLDWKVFSSSCLPKKFREDWSFGGLTYKISGIPDGEWPQSHNKVRVIFLWIIHCDKDYLSQFSQFSVVTSQYNGQFSSSYYIFVLINILFHAKMSHSHWLQASIYSQYKAKIFSGLFSVYFK